MAAKTKKTKVKKSKTAQSKPAKVRIIDKPEKTSKNPTLNKSFSVNDIRKQINLDESYISLVLGFGVVILVFVIAIFFLKGENSTQKVSNPKAPIPTVSATNTPSVKGKTYIMQENESLWDIAVREYGDGFAYTKIIEANKFENPDYVPPGTKIIIPPAN